VIGEVHDLRGARRLDASRPIALALPASWLYGLGARTFHVLHDRGVLRARRVAWPVVSIGSLAAGGSGTTPFTRWLANRLAGRGRRPAIVSRGYRSGGGPGPRVVDPERPDARRDGDEPALLARTCPGVPVVVSADRARGAALAAARGADVILLDDGFQHRRLERDLDLVLWTDAAQGVLPRGSWREPLSGLRRAHALVLVDRGRGDPPPPARHGPEPTFRARLHPVARSRVEAGTAVHALSGIADPASFEDGLVELGLAVTGATRYPDHHRFTRAEVVAAAGRAAAEGAAHLAVTAKDRTRWPRDLEDRAPVPAVFDLDVEVESEDLLLELVDSRLGEAPR